MARGRRAAIGAAFPELMEARARAGRRETLTNMVLFGALMLVVALASAAVVWLYEFMSWLCGAALPYLPRLAPSADAQALIDWLLRGL